MSILEPEEYQEARNEYWQIHMNAQAGGALPGEVDQWILISLFIKAIRRQNELLTTLIEKLDKKA